MQGIVQGSPTSWPRCRVCEPGTPPESDRSGPLERLSRPPDALAAAFVQGSRGDQMGQMRGIGRQATDRASGGPRLTEFRSIGSCPMAECAAGLQALSGATKSVAPVRGAHDRPPARVWRPGSGFGFRSLNLLSTPMLEFWRWRVCRPQTWGAPVAAGSPPPCSWASAASCGGGAGPGVEADPSGRAVEAAPPRCARAKPSRRGVEGCRVEAGRSRRWHPAGGIEAPAHARGRAPGTAWSKPSRAGRGRGAGTRSRSTGPLARTYFSDSMKDDPPLDSRARFGPRSSECCRRGRSRALTDRALTPWTVGERWAGLSRAVPGRAAKARLE